MSANKARAVRCEVETVEGLEVLARDELKQQFGAQVSIESVRSGEVGFSYTGTLESLKALSLAGAVFTVQRFDVPRPKALLGHQHFTALLGQIEQSAMKGETFRSFYLGAAGDDSSVMQRLKQELAQHTGLMLADDKGDLLIRLRRAGNGWEALVRLTARPLATRGWRVCNFEGALNATVARAMALLSQPTPDDVVVNLCCGSGSLLVERLLAERAHSALGVDVNTSALRCAGENLGAAECSAGLLRADGRRLPLGDTSADVLLADLPFGQLVGTHAENVALYPALLAEAARVARPDGRFVLITHEIRLMESLLSKSQVWSTRNVLKITLRGLHPRIYVLRKQQTLASIKVTLQ